MVSCIDYCIRRGNRVFLMWANQSIEVKKRAFCCQHSTHFVPGFIYSAERTDLGCLSVCFLPTFLEYVVLKGAGSYNLKLLKGIYYTVFYNYFLQKSQQNQGPKMRGLKNLV